MARRAVLDFLNLFSKRLSERNMQRVKRFRTIRKLALSGTFGVRLERLYTCVLERFFEQAERRPSREFFRCPDIGWPLIREPSTGPIFYFLLYGMFRKTNCVENPFLSDVSAGERFKDQEHSRQGAARGKTLGDWGSCTDRADSGPNRRKISPLLLLWWSPHDLHVQALSSCRVLKFMKGWVASRGGDC